MLQTPLGLGEGQFLIGSAGAAAIFAAPASTGQLRLGAGHFFLLATDFVVPKLQLLLQPMEVAAHLGLSAFERFLRLAGKALQGAAELLQHVDRQDIRARWTCDVSQRRWRYSSMLSALRIRKGACSLATATKRARTCMVSVNSRANFSCS